MRDGSAEGEVFAFINNRWLVFVAAMWIQSCAGIGYLFGSISPVMKSSLNYNQRQVARLGVAKDLGDSVGFLAGSLCEVLPLWGALLVGAFQNFVGYGWVWLIVTGRAPILPLWADHLNCYASLDSDLITFIESLARVYISEVNLMDKFNLPEWHIFLIYFIGFKGGCVIFMGYYSAQIRMCILIFVGTNGETYFNTAALVSTSPKAGVLWWDIKGVCWVGWSNSDSDICCDPLPDHASLIFMVAVGPAMVIIALMFIIRPVGGHRQVRSSDGTCFSFIYGVCLLLAAYLMAVMLLEDLIDLKHTVIVIFTVVLLTILLIPILIPVSLTFCQDPRDAAEVALLTEPQKEEPSKSESDANEMRNQRSRLASSFREAEENCPTASKASSSSCRRSREGQEEKGSTQGEDFTLMQALIKADFWLLFFSLLLGSGSGLTVIDNLGQMSQSLGYDNTHIFVSLISIWNFLGRIGGGYFSEIIVRDYAYPRPVAMAVAQIIMAFGHFFLAMGWNGAMYIGTLLIGLGYGAHWAIVPAAASELFGLKKFGALYNFLTLANPAGSLIFSGLIASTSLSAHHPPNGWNTGSIFLSSLNLDEPPKCEGAVCFFLTSMIMSGLCMVAVVLSMILVYRTKIVYAHLYGKSRT
ncbi:unnamed protein product, partial [Thlaspi arvense]